jgi:hypothetical protein
LNEAAIEHAANRGWISDWEETFLHNTKRKRVLSDKQAAIRWRINQKVLRQFNGSAKPPSS